MSSFIDCFEGIIGVQSCSTTQLKYDIAKLPGISIESIEKVRDKDTDTFKQSIDNVIFRAVYRLKSDLLHASNIKMKSYRDELCLGRLASGDEAILVPADSGHGGVYIDINQSKYVLLSILNIYFYTDNIYTVDFLIHDVYTNTLIDIITVETTEGDNIIPVNLELYAQRYDRRISITYDLSTANHYLTYSQSCYDACSCSCPTSLICGCNSLLGYKDLMKSNLTFGLGVSIRTECSFEKFICNNLHILSESLWYAGGIEYFDEMKGSPNINKFTKTNAENYDELRNTLKSKYNKALDAAIKNLNFNDNCCFVCDSEKINYVYARP